ncbi:tetratricopeptide repeat protein [Puniceibacterium sp. IMCC21224]|uniref:tetratricopeptide repeat protein n=1 Tax=Puniceibacterium sp. IMCC21224 TaxID=1618204 RepID=UPI00065D2A93|nr:tetratricopeptide repeat protein [Puniceibacterium sp. IMCC21224]KMK63818.1 Tetratricopeptide repeat [Puniceibacterium sp. IMCC21224]
MHTDIRRFRPFLILAVLCSSLFLAACESSDEKAERYFQSGMSLLASGDEERALIEFRNVFKYNGFHKDARKTYADVLVTQGKLQEAYSQYLRLIEQYPDTVEVRRSLAEMAIQNGNWDEAERHGRAALALTPDDPQTRAIGLALDYRQASIDRNEAERGRIAQEAATLLDTLRAGDGPDNDALVRIAIDHLASGETPADALPVIDAALERSPEALDLNTMKVRLLAQSGDTEATGAQLRRMISLFPDNREMQQALINWYLVQKDIDSAEAFLRDLAGPDTGETTGHLSVVQLLQTARGPQAARDELERLSNLNADTDNGRIYGAMLASMDFEAGQTDAGITGMRASLEGAETGEQSRRLQIMLAQMLARTGERDEAGALVDQVLTEDTSNVAALKMRARWLVDADKPGEAIIALRTALNQNPRDSETLTLMAMAHERDGDTDLMGERLALAVEVSASAPAESVRYARFLLEQGREQVAIAVLEDARQRAPETLDLLLLLADIHLRSRAWPQAQVIVDALRTLDTPQARQAAPTLQAAILQGQNRTADSLLVLEAEVGDDISDADRQATRAMVLIVQTKIRDGKIDEARAYLDDILAQSPDNPDLQLLNANLHALMGEMKPAEAVYRELIDRFPQNDLPVRLLMGVLSAAGREDELLAVLTAAQERMPDAPNLLWIRASLLERNGDIDGAIGVYETLYARDSSNTIVANNLASLITAHRDGPESLERGFSIARRLRGTDVPAFQDTYGWIEYLRGNADEALRYLEPAAGGLPTDPLAQYHLGMTYAALGRDGDARTSLIRALDIAGDSPLPQFQKARDTLADLPAATTDQPPQTNP